MSSKLPEDPGLPSTESHDIPPDPPPEQNESPAQADPHPQSSQHTTLKYHLLGPSLTKSGQDNVDQQRVSEIIYNASKGSRFFANEVNKDKSLTTKIARILAKKRSLERQDLRHDTRRAEEAIARLELGRDLSQTIVHVDCDAFYAAVEELDRPELKDVPFAVGKGVVTTCNYVARKFGIRSAMAGFVADKLCPQLVHIPLNFEKYTAKAKEVRAVLERYDARFESASIDEAYLNITEYCTTHAMDPQEAVSQMRSEVHAECGITISAGIAANTKLAKICSNRNKPNGQFYLASERSAIMAFMRDLPTRKVNGVGRVFERELDAIGVKTCGDIYEHRAYLARLFGQKAFDFLIGVYLGLGRTDVRPAEEYERKSVGTESTFHDMSDPKELREKLRWIAEELEKDMKRTQFKGRTLVLKIKLHSYEVYTRQVIPPKAVHLADDLYKYSLPMLAKLETEIPKLTLRLMGLRCTHLISTKKASDFFGRRTADTADADSRPTTSGDKDDDDQWEKWPDEEFEDAAQQERQEDMDEIERSSQQMTATLNGPAGDTNAERQAFEERKHDNGFAWRLLLEEEKAKEAEQAADSKAEEMWDCPICSLPQAAEDRSFNAHIDGCLSRQAIREIVRTTSSAGGSEPNPGSRKRAGGGDQKANDAKRSKSLFFA